MVGLKTQNLKFDKLLISYCLEFDKYFPDVTVKLERFILDGLVECHDDRLQVSSEGRFVIRNIAMAFDAYLDKSQDSKRRIFSRTI